MILVNFDEVGTWESAFGEVVCSYIDINIIEEIKSSDFEFIDEPMRLILRNVNFRNFMEPILDWFGNVNVICYHGTRLRLEDLDSIQERGLVPLCREEKNDRLKNILSNHPKWEIIKYNIDEIIFRFSQEACIGRREGQVHCTLSKNSLINGFSHYLKYGSEYIQRILCEIIPKEEAYNLLKREGDPYVIDIVIPGEVAINSTNRFFNVNEAIERGEVPGLIKEFLKIWSCRIRFTNHNPASSLVDCGFIFYDRINISKIIKISKL